jgi:hypothetical protein
MRKLELNITKAQLTGFRVELKEETPEVGATISLFTDGDAKERCSQLSQLVLFTAAVFPPYRHRNC